MMRPPSSMVGTTPLGFMSRYHFWSLPPNAMPTFSRSYFSPHSSAHHSTFMTLIELARPQIFIVLPLQDSSPFIWGGVGVLRRRRGHEQPIRLVAHDPSARDDAGTSPSRTP